MTIGDRIPRHTPTRIETVFGRASCQPVAAHSRHTGKPDTHRNRPARRQLRQARRCNSTRHIPARRVDPDCPTARLSSAGIRSAVA
jgi:hypothetical protein